MALVHSSHTRHLLRNVDVKFFWNLLQDLLVAVLNVPRLAVSSGEILAGGLPSTSDHLRAWRSTSL